MKKLLLMALSFAIATAGIAQGKGNGKGKNKVKDKGSKHANKSNDRYENDNTGIFGGNNNDTYNNGQGKSAKNQPAKVRQAFYRDFPNATNVNWTKSQGTWTATFNNGGIFNNRTAVTYRSNGQRTDGYNNTATTNQQRGSIFDRILNRRTN